MKDSVNILVCGVGGQGVLLFSDILSQAAMLAGYDVKKSEVHGMAQRGGSVNSHVRFAPRVYSPLIEEGTADFLVAFELLEALRYLHYLAPSGYVFVDTLQVKPMTVLLGTAEYPPDCLERIQAQARKVRIIEAFRKARELGQSRAQNVVMLGALSHYLKLEPTVYEQAIRESVKARFLDLNLRAFAEGRNLVGSRKSRTRGHA